MIDQATGYNEQIECECRPCRHCDGEGTDGIKFCDYCSGTGIDSEDCPVHVDVDGKPFPNGVCCRVFAETGKGHAYNCGNYAPVMAYQVDFQEAL